MPHDSQQTGGDSVSWASRRRFIQAAGAASIVGLAGCQADTSDQQNNAGGGGSGNQASTGNQQSGNQQSGSQPVDAELTLDSLGIPASDVQWNEFNFSNYKWLVQAHVMDPFAVWDPVNNEFVGLLAKDWTVDTERGILQLTLNQNYKWHDGEKVVRPVKAKDVYTHFQMEQYAGWSSSEYVSKIEESGEYSITFHLKGGYSNKDFIRFNLLLNVLSHGLPQYQDWIQKFEKAKNQDAKDHILQNLAEFTISNEEMYSYGPFAVKDASRQKLNTVKNPGHPAADKINFPRMAFLYVGSTQKLWQSLANGQLDGHVRLNVPQGVQSSFPSHVEDTKFSSLGGLSLAFKWDHDVVGDPRVRRAIGYIIDENAVARNAGPTYKPVALNTGLAPAYNSDYLQTNKYIEYGANHEKATSLLEDAGFTKQGNQWMTPDGNPFGPNIKTGTTGGQALLALQTVTSQLNQFGVSTQLQTMEATSFIENIWNQGDFTIATAAWGADFAHPYAWYNNTFVETRENMDIPKVISIPPIGNLDGPENAIRMDLDTAVNNLTKLSGEEFQQQVRELAWAYDAMVPQLQLYESLTQTWFTDDDWNYPALDSDIMQRKFYTPFHYILKTGKFTAETN